jgi:hypothetical protein
MTPEPAEMLTRAGEERFFVIPKCGIPQNDHPASTLGKQAHKTLRSPAE